MKYLGLIVLPLILVACGAPSQQASTDSVQRAQTEKLVSEANRQTGLPNITNFTEKKFAKTIYEQRDQVFVTYSYFTDLNGGLHLLCESVGYGLPYSVQYVNPEKTWMERDLYGAIASYNDVGGTIPQPEPNGLFMPDSLSATWVACSDGKGGIKPVYFEPLLVVSPFPLIHEGDVRVSK